MRAPAFTAKLAVEYEDLFYSAQIKPSARPGVDASVARIVKHRGRYENVELQTNVPWYFIACIHALECSLDFSGHLHNGDPLTARTVQVPVGRPKTGSPPFTWEASAYDALVYEGFDCITDWSLARMCYLFEKYNGWGYRLHAIHSPYLWSMTQHYTRGKYIRDGVFSATAVSKQVGIACVLRRMTELNIVSAFATRPSILTPDGIVLYNGRGAAALALQRRLNRTPGILLREDGIAGQRTSDAYKRVYGVYLTGDPRGV